jgi:hypothetical protein
LLGLAGLGVTIGYLRGFRAILTLDDSSQNQTGRSTGNAPTFQEPGLLLLLIALLILACIVTGLFPSLIIEPLQRLTFGLTIPIG